MTREAGAVSLFVTVCLSTTAAVSAQEPAASFDALSARVEIGQNISVTDATGREVHGRLERLSSDRLELEAHGLKSFAAGDVRVVRRREHDSPKNGALIGLAAGAGLGTAWCIGAIADDSGHLDARVECAEGFIVFPGFGALVGLGIDALIPGKMRVLYRASTAARRGDLTVLPVVAARARGLALSYRF
jgi:hypothetical protein